MEFDPNLHPGPKKRIFPIVNTKDSAQARFFLSFSYSEKSQDGKNEFVKFSKAAVEPFPEEQVSTMTRNELTRGSFSL